MLAAKTERYKFLRKQYQNLIERLQNVPKIEAVSKTGASEELGLYFRRSSDETPIKFKEEELKSCYKSAQNVPNDIKNDIIEKYLQSLHTVESKTNVVRKNNQRYPFTMTSNNRNDYLGEQNGLRNVSEGNKATLVADEIMESIYLKEAVLGDSSSKNSFLNNNNRVLDDKSFEDEHHRNFPRSGDHELIPRHTDDEGYSYGSVVHRANKKSAEDAKKLLPSHHVQFTPETQEERNPSEPSPLTKALKNYNELSQNQPKVENHDEGLNEKSLKNDVLENYGQHKLLSKTGENTKIKALKSSDDDNEVETIAKEEPPQELHKALPESVVCKAEVESKDKIKQESQQNENQAQRIEHVQNKGSGKTDEEQEHLQTENDAVLVQSQATISEEFVTPVQMYINDAHKVGSQENTLTLAENVKHEQGHESSQEQIEKHNESDQQLLLEGSDTLQYYDQTGQPHNNENDQSVQQYNEKNQHFEQYDKDSQLLQQCDSADDQKLQENEQTASLTNQEFENGETHKQQYYDENGQYFQQYDESGQPLQQYYDENGQPLQYDENGLPYQQYGIYGQQTQVMYDENGELVQQYDEYGQPIQYDQQYDENGQLIQQTYDEHNQQYYGYDENGQPLEHYQQEYAMESVQPLDEDAIKPDITDQQQEVDKHEENSDKGKKPPLSETDEELNEGSNDVVEPEQALIEQGYRIHQGVEDEKKPHNVMEMLDTDTESSRQDTKDSHDSDFDISASQK